MSIDLEETIVALSTASGPGARAIIRLSGPKAFIVLQPLLAQPDSLTVKRQSFTTEIRLPELHSTLPVELLTQVAPHSYTGQHLIEIHMVSSPPLVELLIAELLKQGARAAQPGELTMRAFLTGKLDLTRAEAVIGVIEADNRHELKEALTQMAGGMATPLQQLRDDLLNLLADVEAELDFSDEEDISFVHVEEMLGRISAGMAQITNLARQVDSRSTGDRPFRIVLAGRPNAGKSSLYNALAGTPSALVSETAGTTRDYLTQQIDADGITVELVDTAGWDTVEGLIEEQSQALGQEQTEQADLVVLCIEAGVALTDRERAMSTRDDVPVMVVSTKIDKAPGMANTVHTSAITRQGLPELRTQFSNRARETACPTLAPSLSRCRHHISGCLENLRRAHAVVLYEDPREILAMELRGALEHLGQMAGTIYTDDLLDRIFSRFCIGK